jgi:hypothetical protein
MNTKIIWQSIVDPSIEVETSFEALELALAHPGDPKYLDWIQVLRVVNNA